MNTQNSTRARVFRRSLMALACAAAGTSSLAQTAVAPAAAASSPDALQRVEVTGSRIKQIDVETASPVQVLRREDIKKTGATNVNELLATLTATSTGDGSISDVNGAGTFSPGASQASLRNLGAHATLVLLNGRRLPTYPLPNFQETFTNIDTIPLDAIDRVEILKVGGSAVYGSDAIAGVINFITRQSFEGLQIGGSDQTSLKTSKIGERNATLTGGLGNYDRDGYNVFGSTEWFQRDQAMWSSLLPYVNPAYKQVSPSFGSYSSYTPTGNLDFQSLLPCTGQERNGECFYNRYSRFEAVPHTERVNSILGADVRVNSDTDWHSEVQLSNIHSVYQSAYTYYGNQGAPQTWLNASTGQLNYFYERGLPVTNPLNTTGEDENTNDFRYRFADSGASDHTDSTSYRVLTSLKGTYHDWDYDTAIGVMGAHTKDRQHGNFSLSGFIQEVGDPGHVDPSTGALTPVAADFFDVPGGYQLGGPNTAQVLNTLFPAYGSDGTYRQYFIDGNVSGTIAQLPAGPLQLSVGAEARHESLVLTPTQNLADDDIVGIAQSQSDGSRTFEAIYSELGIPILKNLRTNLAARVDKFPNFGAHVSPRANVEYTPIEVLKLRGTVETGFRAPNLEETSESTKSAYAPGVVDPKRCPAAQAVANSYYAQANATTDPNQAAALNAEAEQIYDQECNASVNEIALNNPNLKPERSLSRSFGAVLQLATHWSASIDWWSIDRKNEINLKSIQDLLSAEASNGAAITRAPLDPTGTLDPSFTGAQIAQYGITAGPLASVKLQYENLFQTRTSGIDFGMTGETDTPVGKLTTTLEGTYAYNFQVYSPTRYGTGGWGDNLEGRWNYSRLHTNLTNSLAIGAFTHTIRWAHASGTNLQADFDDPSFTSADCPNEGVGLTPSQCRVHAYNRYDYALEFTGIKNLTLGANITNVLGKRPQPDFRAFLQNGSGITPQSVEDVQGRVLKVYFNYKFL